MKTNLIITGIIQSAIALVPSLLLFWKSYESKKPPLAVRIIRKEKEIKAAELEKQQFLKKIETGSEIKITKLKIELESLKEEASYQKRLSKWESGELTEQESKQNLEQLNSKISDFKEKGEQIIQKGTAEIKKTVEDLKEKESGLVKGISEQFKNLKDKVSDFKK